MSSSSAPEINPVSPTGLDYEWVTSGATAVALGPTGAAGDLLVGLLIVPQSISPGAVQIIDSTTSNSVFEGGTSSVSTLIPFFVPINAKSVNGAWRVSTGAAVRAMAVGRFT